MQCHGCGVEVSGYAKCPVCGVSLLRTSTPQLPDEPWELTAPESYVLRYGLGDHRHSRFGFQLGLTELIARRALTLQGAWVRRRCAPGRYPTFMLCDGPHKAAVVEPSLQPVLAMHTRVTARRARGGVPFEDPEGAVSGVLLRSFVSFAANRNGGYRKYLERDVAGSLRERGLYSGVNALTPAGRQAWDRLDAWVEVSKRDLFGRSHDETWLRAYVSGAGASVFIAQFLSPGSPVLKHIGNAVAACPSPDWSLSAAAWDATGLDFAGLADSIGDTLDAGFIDVGVAGGGG